MPLVWHKAPGGNGYVADWARGTAQIYKVSRGRTLPLWRYEIFEAGALLARGHDSTKRRAQLIVDSQIHPTQ